MTELLCLQPEKLPQGTEHALERYHFNDNDEPLHNSLRQITVSSSRVVNLSAKNYKIIWILIIKYVYLYQTSHSGGIGRHARLSSWCSE